jgi:hypothetical protein
MELVDLAAFLCQSIRLPSQSRNSIQNLYTSPRQQRKGLRKNERLPSCLSNAALNKDMRFLISVRSEGHRIDRECGNKKLLDRSQRRAIRELPLLKFTCHNALAITCLNRNNTRVWTLTGCFYPMHASSFQLREKNISLSQLHNLTLARIAATPRCFHNHSPTFKEHQWCEQPLDQGRSHACAAERGRMIMHVEALPYPAKT